MKKLKKKNKIGIANFLLSVAILFFVFGIIFFSDELLAFFCFLTSTILSLYSNYLRNGYFKFFN